MGAVGHNGNMTDASTLSDFAKYEFLAWLIGGIAGAVFAVKNMIVIWQMLKGTKGEFITRLEFRPLRERVERLEKEVASSVSRHELTALKEMLELIRQDQKDQGKTLDSLAIDVAKLNPYSHK